MIQYCSHRLTNNFSLSPILHRPLDLQNDGIIYAVLGPNPFSRASHLQTLSSLCDNCVQYEKIRHEAILPGNGPYAQVIYKNLME
jgi:hypothetical protein